MARKDDLPRCIMATDATITSGQTTSAAVDLAGTNLVGLIFPASFTGATVTFQGSVDGTNFYPLVNTSGTTLSVTVSTSSYVCVVPSDFAGVNQIKIVSASSEAAGRTITLAIRQL